MYALIGMLAAGDNGTGVPTWIAIASPFVAAGIVGLLAMRSATKAAKIAAASAKSAAEIAAGSAESAARIAAESAAKDTVERSLERFHGEQCWQAKRDAYRALLRGLTGYLMFNVEAERIMRVLARDRAGPGAQRDAEALGEQGRATARELAAEIRANALFVSKAASAICSKCMGDAIKRLAATRITIDDESIAVGEKIATSIAAYNDRQTIIMQTMDELTALGRKDLNITWPEH